MDTFKIEINIKEESDLYNSFDRYNKTLSEDLISYVSKKLELATIKDQIQIEIISDEKLDEKSIKTTFEEYCDEQLKINAKSISESLLYTVISTIGSFSIWESANSWIVDRKIIKFNKFKLIKLKKSSVICNTLKSTV